MIYLIAGRTGAGKDYLVAKLIELSKQINGTPWKQVKSYATRPPRTPDEDTHTFISPEKVKDYKDKMVAYTKIGDYEYFATDEQVLESDMYIVDPNGIEELTKNMPDTEFQIVYVRANDDINRRINAVKRAENKIKEEEIFDKRNAAEDEQFTEFEDKINNRMDDECCFPENVTAVIMVTNDYSDDCLSKYASLLIHEKTQIRKMCTIIKECVQLGILTESENTDSHGDKKIVAFYQIDDDIVQKEHTIEHCAIRIIGNDESFTDVIGKYIALSPRFEPM